jgi:hypothetical protein
MGRGKPLIPEGVGDLYSLTWGGFYVCHLSEVYKQIARRSLALIQAWLGRLSF